MSRRLAPVVHALDLLGTFAFALSGASLIVAVLSRSAAVEIAAAVLATAIRLASLRYRWSAPRPRL